MRNLNFFKRLLQSQIELKLYTLLIFLMVGNAGYGIDISEDFINEETIINNDGNGIEVIASNLNIINSGILKGKNSEGNGIRFRISKGNVRNNGVISGFSDSAMSVSGNGIRSGEIDLINTGVISGVSVDNEASGNGIRSGGGHKINTGIISGVSIGGDGSGNGIDGAFEITSLENSGIISGTTNEGSWNTGNGFYADNIGFLTNTGIIQGAASNGTRSGNGVTSNQADEDIINIGVISGVSQTFGNSIGTGIWITHAMDGAPSPMQNLLNKGIVKGSNQAVKGTYVSFVNNGILAGQIITDLPYTNNGIAITLDNTGNVIDIENGNAGVNDGKTILNGNIVGKDSSTSTLTTGTNYDNYIINGAGIDKGALIIDENTELTNSVINGYNTAVYIESEKTLTATNTIFNGGGLKNDIAVIKGDNGNNTLNILGDSIINGAVDLGDGTNTLTIANTVQINGKLDGGTGAQDTLNLGESQITKVIDSPNLNILHDITGFENINTNGNITLFETVNVTGANDINLESGNLVLRVDPTVVLDGKVTGHALYGNNGTLTSTGGNLVVGLNGLEEGTTISMGGTTITPETNDSWWKDTDHIKTNSLVLDGKLSADGKDINITVLESIPLEPSIPVPPVDPPINPEPPIDPPINPEPPIDPPVEPPIVVDSLLYKKLNKVYQSIVSAGEIGNLANTTLLEDKTYNESLGGLLTILDQIYANNPYAYTLKSSRDSLKLFEDNMSYLTIKPKKDEMIVQGKAIYTGVKNDSSASEKNYYGFDTGHRNYKTTTNTVGGLATFEYGLSDDTSIGFVFGGNNQDVKFKGSSKIKGNSLYLGTFAKTDIKNFKFMSGIGYQYTSADADRKVSNRYDSFSTGDKYDINSLNAFVEAKYIYNAEQDWTVEPKVRLSYYYIDQDKVNERYTPGQISMRTDKVDSNTADIEVGVDFVKSIYLNNGKLKNILSLGVTNTIGDKSKELNGYILGKEKDGKKFEIQGVELPKTSGKVSYNLELEQTNGMIYTTGVSLEFAKDYNRNVSATVGIGYKF